MDTSSFSDKQQSFPDAELLPVEGSTCDCYKVRLYGKLHFLKRLKPNLSTDPRYVAALTKEFETGFALEHPNLVRYISRGDDYLLMEYVDGETLSQFVNSHPDYFKSRKNTNRFLSQLLDVLVCLHAHQVVHLDLKPDNILITRIGKNVKLTDLGYCYTNTYTDTMGRTDKYAAPEQLEGGQVDARTDLFAIGKILETLPCPFIYNKVIARCTKADKEDRYDSAEDMLSHLPGNSPFSQWWFALFFVLAMLFVFWLYLSSQTTVEEGIEKITDTVKQDLLPQDSTDRIVNQPLQPKSEKQDSKELLEADIRQAVDSNLAIILDTCQDSIRRSRDPNYSAGTYLKGLNTASANQLSVKYPQISKDHIIQAVDDYTSSIIGKMSKD